jgi:hypothetical protein
MGKKFSTPQNAYSSVIQSAATETAHEEKKQEFYRFNLRFPAEYRDYLQEMAWRNRMTATEYLTKLVAADMEQHPNWKDTLDVLNGK